MMHSHCAPRKGHTGSESLNGSLLFSLRRIFLKQEMINALYHFLKLLSKMQFVTESTLTGSSLNLIWTVIPSIYYAFLDASCS